MHTTIKLSTENRRHLTSNVVVVCSSYRPNDLYSAFDNLYSPIVLLKRHCNFYSTIVNFYNAIVNFYSAIVNFYNAIVNFYSAIVDLYSAIVNL